MKNLKLILFLISFTSIFTNILQTAKKLETPNTFPENIKPAETDELKKEAKDLADQAIEKVKAIKEDKPALWEKFKGVLPSKIDYSHLAAFSGIATGTIAFLSYALASSKKELAKIKKEQQKQKANFEALRAELRTRDEALSNKNKELQDSNKKLQQYSSTHNPHTNKTINEGFSPKYPRKEAASIRPEYGQDMDISSSLEKPE